MKPLKWGCKREMETKEQILAAFDLGKFHYSLSKTREFPFTNDKPFQKKAYNLGFDSRRDLSWILSGAQLLEERNNQNANQD